MWNLIRSHLSRRAFLQVGAIGVSGLTLADVFAADGQGSSNGKSVIMVYLPGGPSHIDMFDMKPQSPAEIRGEFHPIRSNISGLEVCELLPMLSQVARSLLIWKIFGRRTDGFSNDDFAIETVPGDPTFLKLNGKPVPDTPQNRKRSSVGYVGSIMPPPAAVAGDYVGPDGEKIKVPPLSDEDRRTIVRWIDLGCPIDLDYDPAKPQERGFGWMQDDNRPTLTLAYPQPGANAQPLNRILIGMHDYDTGLELETLTVTADFEVDGQKPGQNLAPHFNKSTDSVWQLTLKSPITRLRQGKLIVSVEDRQGNVARIDRSFSVKTD